MKLRKESRHIHATAIDFLLALTFSLYVLSRSGLALSRNRKHLTKQLLSENVEFTSTAILPTGDIVMVLCTLLQNNRHFFQNRHNSDWESIFS